MLIYRKSVWSIRMLNLLPQVLPLPGYQVALCRVNTGNTEAYKQVTDPKSSARV